MGEVCSRNSQSLQNPRFIAEEKRPRRSGRRCRKQRMRLLHVICTTDSESGGPIEALKRISDVMVADGHGIQAVSLESPEEAARRSFSFPLIGVGRGLGKYRYAASLTRWRRQNAENY